MKTSFKLFGVIFLAVSLSGCLNRQTDQTTTTTTDNTTDTTTTSSIQVSDLSTLPPTSFDAILDSHYQAAQFEALDWRADALLAYVSVELDNLTPNAGKEVYVYGSAGDLDYWWTYNLDQQNPNSTVRALIRREDFLGEELTPINLDFWKMNYVEALQIAEQNGGADFRSANPNTAVKLFLSHRQPRNWLWWTIEYQTITGQTFTLLVNPFRGEVVDEAGNEVSDSTNSSTQADTTTSTDTITP
ncbi:hypothetical protein KC644_00695 [Candidatus Berkelbacteria bacterium]|nr:hypothetical protein [Candidatus Berkelbacteria bacterium]